VLDTWNICRCVRGRAVCGVHACAQAGVLARMRVLWRVAHTLLDIAVSTIIVIITVQNIKDGTAVSEDPVEHTPLEATEEEEEGPDIEIPQAVTQVSKEGEKRGGRGSEGSCVDMHGCRHVCSARGRACNMVCLHVRMNNGFSVCVDYANERAHSHARMLLCACALRSLSCVHAAAVDDFVHKIRWRLLRHRLSRAFGSPPLWVLREDRRVILAGLSRDCVRPAHAIFESQTVFSFPSIY